MTQRRYYDDAVTVFARDDTNGRLTFVETLKGGWMGEPGLEGAWFVTVSSDGHHVYTAAEWDNAISVYARVEQYLLFQRICSVVVGNAGRLR